jgi:hypothetical protein
MTKLDFEKIAAMDSGKSEYVPVQTRPVYCCDGDIYVCETPTSGTEGLLQLLAALAKVAVTIAIVVVWCYLFR